MPQAHLRKQLVRNETKLQEHLGFALYDLDAKKMVLEHQSNRYFTPASNTKVLTLYASLLTQSDSIPFISYRLTNDTLYIRPLGDPTFLYKPFPTQHGFESLKRLAVGRIVSIQTAVKIDRYGPGWAWDDYMSDYSPERTLFPIYGNLVRFKKSSGSIQSVPTGFEVQPDSLESTRDERSNRFRINTKEISKVAIPFITHDSLLTRMLTDTLALTSRVIISQTSLTTKSLLYSQPSDSVYKVMMQISDNFIAEQLLLQAGWILTDTIDSDLAIKRIIERYLLDLPDEVRWVDGSGLSRYNLVTPRTMVTVWLKILEKKPLDDLVPLLAAGNKSGTLKGRYGKEKPFVFGKTGTLSNNHSLSGFLKTKKGKWYVFSYMNSNYITGTSAVRSQMEEITNYIYEHF